MRIALLIAGYIRGIQENIDSIYKNIIQDNECDIYIHITDGKMDNKYYNKNTDLQYINDKLKPKLLLSSKNLQFANVKEEHQNIYNQNYKYTWLYKEMNRMIELENINYDIIVKMRPDIHILEPLNYDIDCNYLYIPKDSKMDIKKLRNPDDQYICDMFAYGTPSSMNAYFDFYTQLDNLIELHGCVNETLLYHYFEYLNIKYKQVDIQYMVILSLCNTIAITGDSGSGKSTLSVILKDLFINSFVLECDRYHKWERNDDNWKKYTHLNPEANYLTKMQEDVFDLKIGNSIYQVDYDHTKGVFTDKKSIESKDNIIICGLHSLYLPNNIANLKIYMDTHDNVRIPSKIKRDVKKRGYSIEKIFNQIKDRYDDFQKYIYPQKKNADIVIHLYTDKQFVIETFNIEEEINVFFKVGIKKHFNIYSILSKIEYKYNLEYEGDFIYLCFNECGCYNKYENIIKQIFSNITMQYE